MIRAYEARGARAAAEIVLGTPYSAAWRTDLLERALDDRKWTPGEPITLELRPFQIATIRVRTA